MSEFENALQCSVDGCDGAHEARGWCVKHYNRWKRHGTTVIDNERYSTPEEAFAARTERRGDCLIWTGGKNKGYGMIRVDGRNIGAHKYAWERVNGPVPDGMMVDHRYHCDTACVEPTHLRAATHGENQRNRSGAPKQSILGVRNVSRSAKKFRVRVAGEELGKFATLEEASRVAAERRRELFGEYAGKG